jgi:hypothetical protein
LELFVTESGRAAFHPEQSYRSRPNQAVADGPSDAQKRTFDPLQELAKR